MKTEQVPQDDSPSYSGHKKLIYAVNDKGHYSGIQSSGWEVENFATQMAVAELKQQTQEAIANYHQGKVSALAYHMCHRRFDIVSLAQCTGFYQWQIRRHLTPRVFRGLSQRKLTIYSQVLSVSIAQLSSVPKLP
ncbi:hypothetical protein [uncultured Paraglaciecola sp.]|uniref:hypothetical protein n=1 Tax=uncultured Paraglaciecola sp. TaxID=1765024 RepID=UPI0026110995|nr:hypothetical protein [uncultured Paraglaciecola sp.]